MVNRIVAWIDAGKRFFGKMTKDELFAIAQKCVSEHKKSASEKIDYHHCRWYIGKVAKDGGERDKKIYNDDIILLSLGYLFGKIKKGNKVSIVIGSAISEVANGPEDTKEYMSFVEEKEHILNIAKKHFPNRVKDLGISSIEESADNRDLFVVLRDKEKGIRWLETEGLPVLREPFTSLDIARYLYWVCNKNKAFNTWIKNIASKNHIKKTDGNFPEYYTLIEIACRLNDLLHGVYVQWWAENQNLPDDIVKVILGVTKGIERFPELLDLQDFCKSIMGEQSFVRIYVDRKPYKELLMDKKNQKDKSTTIMKAAWWTSLVLIGLFAWFKAWYREYKGKQQQLNQDNTQKLIWNTLESQWATDSLVSIDAFDIWTLAVYDAYVSNYQNGRHYKTGQLSPEAVKLYIQNELKNNCEWLDKIVNDSNPWPIIDRFITEIFVPQNSVMLVNGWCDVLPFGRFVNEKEVEMANTRDFVGDVEFTWKLSTTGNTGSIVFVKTEAGEDVLRRNGINRERRILEIEELGIYTGLDGLVYTLGIVTIRDNPDTRAITDKTPPFSRSCFVATQSEDKLEKTYSVGLGKQVIQEIINRRDISKEYLYNNKGVQWNMLLPEDEEHQK